MQQENGFITSEISDYFNVSKQNNISQLSRIIL
ncbi:hypothetical protein HNP24_001823 [Chryseobacterium sediminis]|uniref:Uncharacterized protein n=1 Tax=Chryseobacterium sediminis TaxID=1679494 RepID=A0ABR6Q194_9FLAO|nr:hypothetical protein [Chryseobacterium sediminis]